MYIYIYIYVYSHAHVYAIVYTSRFVRVILAQWPCEPSLQTDDPNTNNTNNINNNLL